MSLAEVLTPCLLKRLYLQQVRTTDKKGVELPDEFYQGFIDGAISRLEHEVDLVLTGSPDAVYTERKDSFDWYAEIHYLTNLIHRPIAEITSFSIQYGNYPAADVPLSWVMLRDAYAGMFQITPGPGAYTLPPFPFFSSGLGGIGRHYDPAHLRLTYKAGFVKTLDCLATTTTGETAVVLTPATGETATDILLDCKTGYYVRIGEDPTLYRVARATSTQLTLSVAPELAQSEVEVLCYMYEPLLIETAALLAAVPVLETIANYIYGGPGISGKSLSLDAMSQSRGLAAAPGKSVYAAMEDVYQKKAEANITAILRRFERPRFFSL